MSKMVSSITLHGVEITDNSPAAIKAMEEAVAGALEVIGLKAEEYAKRELNGEFGAPKRIDTGNLRNSVTHDVQKQENAVYVGTNVEYAPYVHEGTARMAPNRFLRNAVEGHAEEYQRILKDITS